MATLATNVSFQCLGLDGKPLAGGKVYTYEAGTTTPKNTYTTHEGDVPNTNPVILDQNGKAKIFLGDGAYRIRIEDKDGALVDDINQISRYVTQSDFAEFQQTVETGINELEQVKDQIDTYVDSSISDQKGYAGGIAPLDESNKVDTIYLPVATDENIGLVKVIDNLTTEDSGSAVSAKQAKLLQDNKLEKSSAFGTGQVWQDVTANRVNNTNYINSTGKPICIAATSSGRDAIVQFYINDTHIYTAQNNYDGGVSAGGLLIVPSGASYKVNASSGFGAGLSRFMELKS